MLNKKDSQAIAEFKKKITHLLGNSLQQLSLFGSKAKGTDQPDSDIDVLVLIKDAAHGMVENILDAAFEVNLKHGVYISPRIITLSVYYHPVWSITPFLRNLKEQGIAL